MSQVYILSDGERGVGEYIVAVYAKWADAVAALKLLQPEPEYADADYREDGDIAILDAGDFYSIVRMTEVV